MNPRSCYNIQIAEWILHGVHLINSSLPLRESGKIIGDERDEAKLERVKLIHQWTDVNIPGNADEEKNYVELIPH